MTLVYQKYVNYQQLPIITNNRFLYKFNQSLHFSLVFRYRFIMISIHIKYNKSLKKLSINKSYTAEELGHLLTHVFQTKDKLLGVTDQLDRFYDLEYLAKNLKSLKSNTFTLITEKDYTEDNMSFASSEIEMPAAQQSSKQQIPEDEAVPQEFLCLNQGCIGEVESQNFFQNVFLEEGEIKILFKTNDQKSVTNIKLQHYTVSSQQKSVVIYNGTSKICELFVDSFDKIEEKISLILNKFTSNKDLKKVEQVKNNSFPKKKPTGKREPKYEKEERPLTVDYSFEVPNRQVVLKQLRKRLDSGNIKQLQYYKLKCELYQHPEEFMCKFSQSQRQQSIDDFRQEIMKSREERIRYQKVLNSFQKPSRDMYNRNSQIPIIVRRNNNVIQKISTNYPISPEQQHSIHLIAELQLKGLITEAEAKFYKSLILYDNVEAYNIFTEYFNQNIDQIQLSKKLKYLKKNSFQQNRAFDYGQPEPLSKLIQKTCSISNTAFLTKLMIQCDEKILAAYDSYLLNRDEALFGQTGDKISAYYRIKQDLEHLQEGRKESMKRRGYKSNISY